MVFLFAIKSLPVRASAAVQLSLKEPSMVMKSLRKIRISCAPALISSPSKPISHIFSPNYSSSSDINTESLNSLTQEELTEINLLISRLCSSNQLPEAIRLVDAALLTNPPLKSLSLPILIDRLAAEADLTQPMSFLNRLKHNPQAHPSLLPITKMLLSSYFKKCKLKEAMKLFNWMSRLDSPFAPDSVVYAIMVSGLCRNAMILEALKVVRAMMGANMVPGPELRTRVYRGLLREARIGEAQELNEALGSIEDGGESFEKVLALLDQTITNWVG